MLVASLPGISALASACAKTTPSSTLTTPSMACLAKEKCLAAGERMTATEILETETGDNNLKPKMIKVNLLIRVSVSNR